jgi:integrase
MTYFLQYRRGRRIKLGSTKSISADHARDAAKAHLSAVYRGKDPVRVLNEGKGYTFLQFVENEYQAWAASHLRTHKKLIQRLKTNCGRFHNKHLGEITPEDFERFRTKRLENGRKRATANRDLDDIRSVLTKAAEWKYIEQNPLARVRKLKTDTHRPVRFLSAEEITRLIEALDQRELKLRTQRAKANAWRAERGYPLLPSFNNHAFADHLKPMVLLSLHTGMRQGEVYDLKWDDVNFATKLVTVQGEQSKSLQSRHIALNSTALKALQGWRDQSPDDVERVFPGKNGGRLDNTNYSWRSVLKTAKILKFRWHDMRHTFASRLVMGGVDLNTVRELLGHADYQMTLRYSHLAPEHKAAAVEVLVAA